MKLCDSLFQSIVYKIKHTFEKKWVSFIKEHSKVIKDKHKKYNDKFKKQKHRYNSL